jgi:benzoate/toluate 1,2-dioxygenase reductase subunit
VEVDTMAEVVGGVKDAVASSIRQVELRFTDSEIRTIEVDDGETVLAAAKRAGHRLASQCEVGTCCTCVAWLHDGTAEMPEGQVTALTRDEVAAGQRLLCQTRVLSGAAAFDLDYPSSVLTGYPTIPFTAKIQRLTWVTDSVVQLDLKVPKAVRLRFMAGQYCRIKIPGTEVWRSFSMASGEHEQGRLSFLVRVLPSGAMSDYLRDEARPGAMLEVEGPIGGFVLEPSSRPHLLIAGGTGLAPMLSMLDKIRLVRPTPPVLLIFGCVREAELFLQDELEARQSFMPTLTLRIALVEPGDARGVVKGNPVEVLRAADVLPDSIAYLCGPPGMISAAEARLVEFGVSPHDVRTEQFLPS